MVMFLPTLLALLVSHPQKSDSPEQIHIAMGDDPKTSMSIVWQTRSEHRGDVVEFWEGSSTHNSTPASRARYAGETGVIHQARITGLRPGTTYTYRVGSAQSGFSAQHTFRTAPAAPVSFTFTAFGDHGVNNASKKNVRNILAINPAFHILLGDISYANGKQYVWDTYLKQLEPLASNIPFMLALGNHEFESTKVNGEKLGITATLARFAMPGDQEHYQFDYAGVRFVCFNSNTYGNRSQLVWLDSTLAAARADRSVRWLIVYHHFPLYGSVKKRGNNIAMIHAVQPLYDKYNVDLVLCGHDHVYERMYPLRGPTPTTTEKHNYHQGEGTLYVTCGGGGDSLYKFVDQVPSTTAFRESTFCYLTVTVPSKGPLDVRARRLNGTELDRFWIAPKVIR